MTLHGDDEPLPSVGAPGSARLDAAILARRSRLWDALSGMSDAVLISSADGKFIEFNQAFSDFHKFPSLRECAKTLSEFEALVEVRTPDGVILPLEQWPIPRALLGETATNVELVLTRRDIAATWIGSYNFAPIRADDGTIIGSFVTARDITEQKAAYKRTEQSERKFRELFDNIHLGITLVRARDGQYMDFNLPFATLMGYDRDALAKLNFWTLTAADHHPRAERELENILREGRYGPYHKAHVRADGSRIDVVMNGILVTGDDGEKYIWSVIEDITERNRQSVIEGYYAAIVESSIDAIISKDLDGLITTWNPSAQSMFGYAPHEIVGKHVTILIPPERLAEENFILERITRGERVEQFATLRLHKNGAEVPVMLAVSPIKNREGRIVGASKILRDMTQQNQTEALLRQSQKMEAIGNLTGGLAHDFNNLLGVIIGNLDLLEHDLAADNDNRELVTDALEAAGRGAELTKALLSFARRQPLHPSKFHIADMVDGTVKLMRRLLGDHIEIAVDHQPGVCPVSADATLLSTALTNLATNARDAMPKGGRLTFQTRQCHVGVGTTLLDFDIPPGEYAVITVSDTGVGIPHDHLNRIFEPFFTSKPRDEGTGLGLSMVFGFIKQSGGHINVYSERGLGTTFRLYLPCVADPATPVDRANVSENIRGRGETILIVEDNIALRRILDRQLRALGYQVVQAGNASEALGILASTKIDLLFSDVIMPGGIDGYELANHVRARWPETRILLTSGFPDRQTVPDGEEARYRLLSKPYRRDDLAQLLREALARA